MPVISMLPPPTVNYVGNTETSPQSPALDPHGFERRKAKYVKMISPEGELEEVLADNVRDFERLRDYRRYTKEEKPKPEAETVPDEGVDEADVTLLAAKAKADEKAKAVGYLEILRTTLINLGGEPDTRWGVKRLQDEITKLGGEVPEKIK